MNYPLRTGIISFLKNKDKSALEYEFLDVMFNAPHQVQHMQMNLLGTHDTERIITILAGDDANGKSNDEIAVLSLNQAQRKRGIELLKMAYTILATVPGIPTVFYGDEVGLEGYKDPFNRRPFPWKNQIDEIRSFYSLIGEIRAQNSVYKDGRFTLVYFDNETLIYTRDDGKDALFTVINNSDNDLDLLLSSEAQALISKKTGNKIMVAKHSSEIIKTTRKTKLKTLKTRNS